MPPQSKVFPTPLNRIARWCVWGSQRCASFRGSACGPGNEAKNSWDIFLAVVMAMSVAFILIQGWQADDPHLHGRDSKTAEVWPALQQLHVGLGMRLRTAETFSLQSSWRWVWLLFWFMADKQMIHTFMVDTAKQLRYDWPYNNSSPSISSMS